MTNPLNLVPAVVRAWVYATAVILLVIFGGISWAGIHTLWTFPVATVLKVLAYIVGVLASSLALSNVHVGPVVPGTVVVNHLVEPAVPESAGVNLNDSGHVTYDDPQEPPVESAAALPDPTPAKQPASPEMPVQAPPAHDLTFGGVTVTSGELADLKAVLGL